MEKQSFSLKLLSGDFYGQSFIKTVRGPLKTSLTQFQLNAGQKYYRMLPLEHSAILLTIIKLPFVIKIFVLSIFEWPFYSGFTV